MTAQVRYKGVSIAQTFDTKTLAGRWVTAVKAVIDAREWPRRDLISPHLLSKWGFASEAEAADDTKPHPGWTPDTALQHYLTIAAAPGAVVHSAHYAMHHAARAVLWEAIPARPRPSTAKWFKTSAWWRSIGRMPR